MGVLVMLLTCLAIQTYVFYYSNYIGSTLSKRVESFVLQHILICNFVSASTH